MTISLVQNVRDSSIQDSICKLSGKVENSIASLSLEHELREMDQILNYLRRCDRQGRLVTRRPRSVFRPTKYPTVVLFWARAPATWGVRCPHQA